MNRPYGCPARVNLPGCSRYRVKSGRTVRRGVVSTPFAVATRQGGTTETFRPCDEKVFCWRQDDG